MKHQKEIQKVVQDHINKLQVLGNEREQLFRELQDEYKRIKNTSRASYSWDDLLNTVKETDTKKYIKYYTRKVKLDSKIEIIEGLGNELAKAGFWKQ